MSAALRDALRDARDLAALLPFFESGPIALLLSSIPDPPPEVAPADVPRVLAARLCSLADSGHFGEVATVALRAHADRLAGRAPTTPAPSAEVSR